MENVDRGHGPVPPWAAEAPSPLSLSSHLSDPRSAVRAFFAQRLPHTADTVREAATTLRDGRATAHLPANPGTDAARAGRAGTAVDYLLRFALAADPCPAPAAARLGAGQLGRGLAESATAAVGEALRLVVDAAPYRRPVSDATWEDLAQISLVFAAFEIVHRSGRPPSAFGDLDTLPKGWREWAALVCVDEEVEDVAVLGWAARRDHQGLRGRGLTCNPTFAQSRPLRGADADLITDTGLLLDFKATSSPRTCSRGDLWQLCGYVLADTDDRYAMRRKTSRSNWPVLIPHSDAA
jgi:hypothetical protein